MNWQKAPSGVKRIAGLIALLLMHSVCAAGIADTGTTFPWREYTLHVTLATTEASLVDLSPAPPDATPVLVELSSLGQDIALTDIQSNIGDFTLRDRNGTEHAPHSWRVRGVTFTNGIFAADPQQKTLELIYLQEWEGAGALIGAKLLIATENKDERVAVALSRAPFAREAESAGAKTPAVTAKPADAAVSRQPEETAAVESSGLISAQLDSLLKEHAALAKSAWQKAIYEAGVRDLRIDAATVTFFLRSFDPQLKSLGVYTDSRVDYLARMMRNAGAYNLSAQLTLDNGTFTKKSLTALKSAVTKAAGASAKAFADKRVQNAIADWLFPAPAPSVKKAEDMLLTSEAFRQMAKKLAFDARSDTYREFAPLFYGQTKQTLDTKSGPHALLLKCVSVSPEALLESARQKTLAAFSLQAYANAAGREKIENAFLLELAANTLTMRKKAAEKFTLTLDVDHMAQELAEKDYTDYLRRYRYEQTLDALAEQVALLPDYPALDFPASGRLSGSTKGTKIILKAPDDGLGRYLQLRDYNTDALRATAFIRPGKSCTVYTPQGDYYILIASGEIWYGEEVLFGDSGGYSRTALFEVASSRYYHTVTLKAVSDGNMSIYQEGSDAFHQ